MVPYNALLDKLVKSSLSKGEVLSVRIRGRVPSFLSSAGRALGRHPEGQWFNPTRKHQNIVDMHAQLLYNCNTRNGPIMVLEQIANLSIGVIRFKSSSLFRSAKFIPQ